MREVLSLLYEEPQEHMDFISYCHTRYFMLEVYRTHPDKNGFDFKKLIDDDITFFREK